MSINNLAESGNPNLNNYMHLLTEEENFEAVFNEVFKKDEPIEEIQEQDREIENKCFYFQNIFTKKEEPLQSIKDIILNEEDITEKKMFISKKMMKKI